MAALSDELRLRLLGAIDTNSLVFLCGAGLSIPAPSGLPTAKGIANVCYDRWTPNQVLAPNFRDDVDALAGHFYGHGDFKTVFLRLVPWNELEGAPNRGHAAVADLLVSRGAHGALSANFDTMIERWAKERKVNLRGALTGQEAVQYQAVSNPLVKFHGCMERDQDDTLWTQGQLAEPEIAARVQSCSDWMTLNLPGRHLVVVGFWTDWGYLNDVLANAFTITNASSVTVIDPSPAATLQAKAPNLWAKLGALSEKFEHVPVDSADFLDELRTAYSEAWTKRFYSLGAAPAKAKGIALTPTLVGLTGDDLYNLRRDAEGQPYTRAATLKQPASSAAESALAHFEILNAGGTQEGAWLCHTGKSVRVINGAGQDLEAVQGSYREPPSLSQPDLVICAGAFRTGVPGKIISAGSGLSIVKPMTGGTAQWKLKAEAFAELGI